MSASSEETNELSLKFLFVNQDGVNVVLKFPKTTKISTVKQSLIESWPESKSVLEKIAPQLSKVLIFFFFFDRNRITREFKIHSVDLYGSWDVTRQRNDCK
jgi:hypothetical protein